MTNDPDKNNKEIQINVKEWFKPGRFTTRNGYIIDRWVLNICMWLVIGTLVCFAWQNNFDLSHVKCIGSIESPPCPNPFYEPISWKNQEFLSPGEYGNPALANAWWINWFVVGVFGLGILINTVWHNKHVWRKP